MALPRTRLQQGRSTKADQRAKRIIESIKSEEHRLRNKFHWLRYQDYIGLTILAAVCAGMVGTGVLYYLGFIPAWLCIVLAGIFASISHELEHDLIHRQYFRDNTWLQNTMMLVVWMMRPNTINPWYRRKIHFLHHKVSGQQHDIEERLVGNGLSYGMFRFVVMFDNFIGLLARYFVFKREIKSFSLAELLLASLPFTLLYFTAWYAFVVLHIVDYVTGGSVVYPSWLLFVEPWLSLLVVTLIAPNFLRSACLNMMTSTMHYYGNVSHIVEQTQVLNRWFLFPLHLFCFNFGSTHGIHHFVVGQPFYLRQMVAKAAHQAMKDNGVRFNDWRTLLVANRYVGL